MIFIDEDKHRDEIGIYGIVNISSNYIYVGQTRESFIRRYWHHRWKLRDGSHDNQYLQNAWNLYGEDNFVFIAIESVDNATLINDLEIEYIGIYRKMNCCYNLIDGGCGRSGIPLSDEHKRKIGEKNRINMLGRKASEETKRKMSEARKGKIIKTKTLVLDESMAFEIKTRLIGGEKASDISKDMHVDYKLINNIISNNTWAAVHVDGWDDFRSNRKTYRRLTKEDHKEIYRLHIEEEYTKKELAEIYNRTEKMIEKIFRNQRKEQEKDIA